MTWTPSRIVLISRGRHDEAVAGADVWPGMSLQQNVNAQTVQAQSVLGGGGLLMVAEEDALQGLDITQKLPSGYVIPFRRPAKGDMLLMLLQNGQNIQEGNPLMNAGDGTLIASTGQFSSVLADIVTPSATVTNTVTTTTFSNGSYAFPANFLLVGDVLKIRAKAYCIAVASAATQQVRVYLGSTLIADSTALALVAADIVLFDITMTIRTITASGTFIADGTITSSIAGSFTITPFTLVSTAFDSTVIETLAVKVTCSAAASGNQIRLDEFRIDLLRSGGGNSLVIAAENINNSGGAGSSPMSGANSGTAAFCRVWVP